MTQHTPVHLVNAGRAHLLLLVLGAVGLELEVAGEGAAAELALVRAVDHHHLLGARRLTARLLGPGGRGRRGQRGRGHRRGRATSAIRGLRRPRVHGVARRVDLRPLPDRFCARLVEEGQRSEYRLTKSQLKGQNAGLSVIGCSEVFPSPELLLLVS